MKKTYDWNIKLYIVVSNTQQKIEVVCSIHTNIHQLKIIIAKQLDLSILDTHIDLYSRSDRPLKATSTLLQNDFQNNSHITATIVRTKPSTHLPIETDKLSKTSSSFKPNKIAQNVGLSIISSCTNLSCVNFNQKVEINYGFGVFPILELASFAKCEVCPYKSQFLRPNMMSHQITVERCYYQLKGTALNSCGIPIAHQTKMLKCVSKKQLQQLLSQNDWHINMQLIVKAI